MTENEEHFEKRRSSHALSQMIIEEKDGIIDELQIELNLSQEAEMALRDEIQSVFLIKLNRLVGSK